MEENSTMQPTLTVLGDTTKKINCKHPEELGAGPFSTSLLNDIAAIRACRPKEQPRRMRRKDAHRVMASKMMGGELGNAYIPFDINFQKFMISSDEDGAKRILKLRNGDVLSIKNTEYLTSTVQFASASLRTSAPPDKVGMVAKIDFDFSGDEYKKISSEIMAGFPYIKTSEIAPFRFKTEPGYCWARLGFEIEPGEHPTIDSIACYLETPEMYSTLKWFIGELFNTGELAHKILWMYGDGGNGKGTMLRLIESVFKSAYASVGTDKQDLDKHWTAALVGKRVAVGTDVENIYIIDHPSVKAISGGDDTPVRGLYKTQVSMKLPCQFIFTSNFKPHYKGKHHQARRLMYVGFKPGVPAHIDNFVSKVSSETPYFLNTCIEYWKECKRTNVIPSDQSALSVLEEEGKEEILAYLNAMVLNRPRFLYGSSYQMDCDVLWQFVQPKNHFVKADITRVLASDYGVEKKYLRCKIRNRPAWVFLGMGINV